MGTVLNILVIVPLRFSSLLPQIGQHNEKGAGLIEKMTWPSL
jgi:hypothetical protein